MDLYLPIAGLSVNAAVIVALGGLVGFMSGLFGVGGGFLTTPLLIFYGIPPAVAVASSAPQVTGSSFAGALAHWRRDGVDAKLGLVMVAGGVLGAVLGSVIFRLLQEVGQIDVVVSLIYVILLGGIGVLMLSESIQTITRKRRKRVRPPRRHHPLVKLLPMRMRFYKAGLYISPLAPFILGLLVGVLTVIMGVGGGFIMVPAMIYILGMQVGLVVGTSLFQIVFVTAATTLLHATQTKAVDIVLAALLLLGGTVGAQFGARAARKLPAEKLRLLLGLIVLSVALRLLVGLSVRPPELYSVFVDT